MRAAAGLASCALLLATAAHGQPQPPAVGGLGRVLVMPFENPTRDARLYWLVEGAAVLLSDDLAALGSNAITRDERLRAFDHLQLPLRSSLSHATVIRVAELVGATDVVIGSLALDGDRLTVRARAITLDTGRMSPATVERGTLAELFSTFDRVARQVAGVPASPAGHTDQAHASLAAFEHYVKGLSAETPASQLKFLETALLLQPGHDAARVALWQALTAQGEASRALTVIAAMPERSPASRRARFLAALSQLQLKRYDEAFATLKGLADQASSAPVFNNLGVVQLRRAESPQGGHATYYFSRAASDDPGSPDYAFNLGYAYWFERDVPAAIYWLREAVRRQPSDADAHYVLGVALKATGEAVAGERELDLARQLSSSYAEAPRPEGGSEAIPRGLERLREDLDRPGPSLVEVTAGPREERDHRELAAFHLERGRRLYDDRQDREAAVELRRSLYLSPYQAEAHLLVGRILLRASRVREAIEAAKISNWCQESAAAHVVLGEAYLLSKDTALARIAAQRAVLLDPRSAEARQLLEKIPPGDPHPPGGS